MIRTRLALFLFAALTLAAPVRAVDPVEPVEPDAPPDAHRVLERAFERRYDVDLVQRVELVVRSRAGRERRRVLEMASRRIDGRMHHLGRFREPAHLRGTAILWIERRDGSDDNFVYLPSEQRVRRVTVAQRADAFLGTDLRYEDFERRRASEFALRWLPDAELEGEPVHVIEGRPRYRTDHARIEFLVARADLAILEVRAFKRGSERPVRVVRAPRSGTIARGGRLIPRLLIVENRERGSETRVRLQALSLDEPLAPQLFTRSALESGRPIPGL